MVGALARQAAAAARHHRASHAAVAGMRHRAGRRRFSRRSTAANWRAPRRINWLSRSKHSARRSSRSRACWSATPCTPAPAERYWTGGPSPRIPICYQRNEPSSMQERPIMLRSRWTSGTASEHAGLALTAVTSFHVDHFVRLPAVMTTGMRLGRLWPELPRAVGTRLWAIPQRQAGRVGVGVAQRTRPASVRRHLQHRAVIRRYRNRGTLTSVSWACTYTDPATAWRVSRISWRKRHRPSRDRR